MKVLLLLFIGLPLLPVAQIIDVQHYRYELNLSDQSDSVKGTAMITVKFLSDTNGIRFDLASVNGGKGFFVSHATEGEQMLKVLHKDDVVSIALDQTAKTGETHTYKLTYSGVPKDGLIISKNKYGDRTFFADNWPNRAHRWIPCNDRPNDKASFEFIVRAPAHYQVISNGVLVEELIINAATKQTHWKEETPLSTKVMVIGVAKFAVKNYSDSPKEVPVSAWVYPQDSAKGFYDYAVAVGILNYFSNYIAPFPYKKLANVQSKTIFGGMENSSAIFYSEQSVTGDRKWEDVIAHEIVHQWFGDMASEKSFQHLWLSEGFATYLTNVYIEKTYGKDSMNRRLRSELREVVAFSNKYKRSVVDTTTNLLSLINANSYQKGGWVLHMMRKEVGDSLFQKIIRDYYNAYKGSNADTRDFQAVVEQVTNKSWKAFFDQWLYQPGIPNLDVKWRAGKKGVDIQIDQKSKTAYELPLELLIKLKDGSTKLEKVRLTERSTMIKVNLNNTPVSLHVDPNTNLLFTATILQN